MDNQCRNIPILGQVSWQWTRWVPLLFSFACSPSRTAKGKNSFCQYILSSDDLLIYSKSFSIAHHSDMYKLGCQFADLHDVSHIDRNSDILRRVLAVLRSLWSRLRFRISHVTRYALWRSTFFSPFFSATYSRTSSFWILAFISGFLYKEENFYRGV